MTRMDCGEVRDLLQSYADDELPAEERRAIARHLETCRACATALAELQTLRQRIKAAGTYAPPPALEQRLRSAIGMADRHLARPGWRRLSALAASHLMVALLGGYLAYAAISRADTRAQISRDIVTAHVRALLSDQLVQVASADTHTVKPWFTGKVPFAPHVLDLADRDFPLIGARVDYVLDQQAAVLVYGRRKHRIDVFVLPAGQGPSVADVQGVRNGYNVVGWRHGGFSYFAASDLNEKELGDFATTLRNGSPG
jgi:anti-sigma factor RsiW